MLNVAAIQMQMSDDKESNVAYAVGDVIWQDTSAGISIFSDHLDYQESTGYVKATNDEGRPLMQNVSVAFVWDLREDDCFNIEDRNRNY